MQEFSPEQYLDQTYPANPFAALLGESIAPTFIKRGKGRPRKHNLPEAAINTHSHKMGDSEVKSRDLTLTQQKSMVEFFKVQMKFNNLRESLENTAEKYGITYSKAHSDLNNYF